MMWTMWRKHVKEDLLKKISNWDIVINTVDAKKNVLAYNEFDLYKIQRALLKAVLETPEKIIWSEVIITKLINWEEI